MAFAILPPELENRLWVSIPVIRLRPPYTKVAISLPELIRQTNAFSVKRRAGCTPTLAKSRPKELFIEYKVVCHENYSDPRGHDVQVQFDLSQVEKTQDAKRMDVRVNCSCPAFLYWGAQWNLHQRDGLHGPARPLLQAPTQRLDLRSNFVICKHIKAVFERILPAIQHNIQNIVRQRQVEETKKRLEEAPPTEKEKKLRERQEEMRKKKEIEKIVETKDPDKQKEMIDELVEEEGKRLEEEKKGKPPALPPLGAPPGAKPEEGKKVAPPPEPKKKVVRREEPAAEPKAPPAPAPPREQPDLDDLIQREQKKLQQREDQKNVPWLQNWLKKLRERFRRKRTSLERSVMAAIAGDKTFTPQEMGEAAKGYGNDVSKYDWKQEDNFPVNKIDGAELGADWWKKWWE